MPTISFPILDGCYGNGHVTSEVMAAIVALLPCCGLGPPCKKGFCLRSSRVTSLVWRGSVRFHASKVYDVVVSGGGMVGSAMAAALGTSRRCSVFSALILPIHPPS